MSPSSSDKLAFVGRTTFLAFCVIAAVFLIYEHTAHVLGILPYLLLLACPLMHIFMHHGHHGGHHMHNRNEPTGGTALSQGRPDTKKDW